MEEHGASDVFPDCSTYNGSVAVALSRFEFGKDEHRQMRELTKRAQSRQPGACADLGHFFRVHGLHWDAAPWLVRASNCGDGEAAETVGRMFEVGSNGIDVDLENALKHYRQAVAAGNPWAVEGVSRCERSLGLCEAEPALEDEESERLGSAGPSKGREDTDERRTGRVRIVRPVHAPAQASVLARELLRSRSGWSGVHEGALTSSYKKEQCIALLLVATLDEEWKVRGEALSALRTLVDVDRGGPDPGNRLLWIMKLAEATVMETLRWHQKPSEEPNWPLLGLESALDSFQIKLGTKIGWPTAEMRRSGERDCRDKPWGRDKEVEDWHSFRLANLFLAIVGLPPLQSSIASENNAEAATGAEGRLSSMLVAEAAEVDEDPFELEPRLSAEVLTPGTTVLIQTEAAWVHARVVRMEGDRVIVTFSENAAVERKFLSSRMDVVLATPTRFILWILKALPQPERFASRGYVDALPDGRHVRRRIPRWADMRLGTSPKAAVLAYVGRIRRLVGQEISDEVIKDAIERLQQEDAFASTDEVAARIRVGRRN
jgi:hypothetical protein